MQVTVNAKTMGPEGKKVVSRTISFEYDIGTDLAGACVLFGEETVWAAAKSELLTSVRDHVRPMLEAGKTDDEIRANISNFKIGIRELRVKDPLEKINKLFAALTPEQQAQVAEILKARK